MSVLFHQNMRRFGGGTPNRNNAYRNAFTNVNNAIANANIGPIVVAGFTEVMNNQAAANAFAGQNGLCNALGVNHLANIACGITALAYQPEYIAIGVNANLNVLYVGRIFLNAWGGGVPLISDVSQYVPPQAGWCNEVDPNATPDYRGLVYVVVSNGNVNIAVGFLHNLYTFVDQRILVAQALPTMMNYLMSIRVPAGIINAGYIGGDFNIPVQNQRGTARIGYIYMYSAGLPANPPPPPPPPFTPGGTTCAGNLYDYWFSNIQPNLPNTPNPRVCAQTLDTGAHQAGPMSDHAAIILQLF